MLKLIRNDDMPQHTHYQMKIVLCDADPLIWRRFVVPADLPLDRLHDVIQIIMGWQDSHLHEFICNGQHYTEDPEEPEEGKDEAFFRVRDLVRIKGKKFSYHYDFGDSWMHDVTLEKTRFDTSHLPCPLHCSEGKGACPPEDSGGTSGYQQLLSIVADPSHREYSSTMTWLEGMARLSCSPGFLPDCIDLNVINHRLAFYWRWARRRYLPFDTE